MTTSYVCFLGVFTEGKELTLFNLTKIDIYFFPQLHLTPWDPPLAFNSSHCVFVLIPWVVLDFAPLLSAFPIDTVPMNLIGWHVGKLVHMQCTTCKVFPRRASNHARLCHAGAQREFLPHSTAKPTILQRRWMVVCSSPASIKDHFT